MQIVCNSVGGDEGVIQSLVGLGDFAKQRLPVPQQFLIVCCNYIFVGAILVDDLISMVDAQAYLSSFPLVPVYNILRTYYYSSVFIVFLYLRRCYRV